jgi:hypothetical protein
VLGKCGTYPVVKALELAGPVYRKSAIAQVGFGTKELMDGFPSPLIPNLVKPANSNFLVRFRCQHGLHSVHNFAPALL